MWIKEKVVLHFPLSFAACLCIVFALSLHCLSIGFAVIVEEGSKFLALSQVVFSLESRFAPLC